MPKNSIKRKRKQKKCEKITYPLDKWGFFAYNNREIIEDRENAERESPHRERRRAESGARDGFGNAPVRCRCEAEGVFGGASDGCPPLAGRRYETYRKEIAHLYMGGVKQSGTASRRVGIASAPSTGVLWCGVFLFLDKFFR